MLALLALPCLALGGNEEELAEKLKGADAAFTAALGKVENLAQTNSIPPSVFGKASFKDAKALHGELPKAKSFSFSYRQGKTGVMDLAAKGRVLVAVKGGQVLAVVPATRANLAVAKKAMGAKK